MSKGLRTLHRADMYCTYCIFCTALYYFDLLEGGYRAFVFFNFFNIFNIFMIILFGHSTIHVSTHANGSNSQLKVIEFL